MSETQPEKSKIAPTVQNSPPAHSGGLLNSWKLRTGLIATVLVSAFLGIFILAFFWQHLVAGMGIKSWSTQAGATPIECMIKDTNSDGYVSCSAMLKGEVVPLECGASIFNIGCRVNYGAAAAPPTRQLTLPSVRGR
jgi:hypothetical protein